MHLFTVFRTKVLESHAERLCGSSVDASNESETDSEGTDGSLSTCVELTGGLLPDTQDKNRLRECEEVSIHEQHEHYVQKQIRLAAHHKEKREQLPRTVSSKRESMETSHGLKERESLSKKVKFSSDVKAVGEQGLEKGPRTVSRAEKNRRRKLKKKKRLARKQL